MRLGLTNTEGKVHLLRQGGACRRQVWATGTDFDGAKILDEAKLAGVQMANGYNQAAEVPAEDLLSRRRKDAQRYGLWRGRT